MLGVPGMNYSHAAAAQLGLRRRTRRSSTRRTPTSSTASSASRCCRCSGTARRRTATPRTSPTTRTRARRATRCCMHVAFGDHQVANVTAEVEARTIGARILLPGLYAAAAARTSCRSGASRRSPFLPWNGSAIVYWDSGNPAPPLGNVPPSEPEFGDDPHSSPRRRRRRSSRSPSSSARRRPVVDTSARAALPRAAGMTVDGPDARRRITSPAMRVAAVQLTSTPDKAAQPRDGRRRSSATRPTPAPSFVALPELFNCWGSARELRGRRPSRSTDRRSPGPASSPPRARDLAARREHHRADRRRRRARTTRRA